MSKRKKINIISEEVIDKVVEITEGVEDRSDFNCPECSGEGLVASPSLVYKVCQNCQGTGKI